MKKYVLSFCILFFFISSLAQEGWRKNEMEVKVFLISTNDARTLSDLHLTGDVYSNAGYALMYVTPAELEKIKTTELKYEILKDNLNDYYSNFWLGKAESYHTYEQIIALMDSLSTAVPSICKKVVIGSTATGKELSYLKISDNVNVDESEAEVAFTGGIHGDELGGPENLIRFARYICKSYGTNTEITNLINNREIFIYTMVNPYGRINTTRYNSNGVDCNRDFGYMGNNGTTAYAEIETKKIRDFMYDNQFTIHVTFHSGIEELLFPWCYRSTNAPNYSVVRNLCQTYATASGYSSLPYLQSYADYPTNGELIDGSYGINGAESITMEISTNKQPTDIAGYYQKNVNPMLAMIKNAGYGLEGLITDSVTGNPIAAAVFVNNYFPVYSDTLVGDYHKYVLAGTYTVKVVANGYQTRTITGLTVSSASSTITNIKMKPANGGYIYKVVAMNIPNNNTADEGNTPAVIGAPDNINYSIGKNGWIIVDMLRPINNITGNDFSVFEGDASPESYTCYASQSMDGPWTSLGTGTGTKEFDLSTLNKARFIKIVDDNDGTATVADAGFDLDAIQVLGQTVPIFSNEKENSLAAQIFPNPFNAEVNIEYLINHTSKVYITFYNVIGENVLQVTEENNGLGKSTINMNTAKLKNGIYNCVIRTDNQTISPVSKIIVKQ